MERIFLDLEVDVDDTGEVVEHLGGLVVVAARHQEARGLRKPEGEEPIDEGRHPLSDEHPPPGLHPQPQLLGGPAGLTGEPGVGQQGGEDADDDRQLLEGAQTAARTRRGDLGDVGRGDDRGHPHS